MALPGPRLVYTVAKRGHGAAMIGNFPIPVSANLARGASGSFDEDAGVFVDDRKNHGFRIFATIKVRLIDAGGQDLSPQYRLWRQLRSWEDRDGDLRKPSPILMSEAWRDDQMGTHGGWDDKPGFAFNPDQGIVATPHLLHEFAVFVEGRKQEIPGIYYAILYSLTAAQYRVQVSAALPIGWAQWDAMFRSTEPWIIAARLKLPVAQDLGWQVIPP